MAREERRKKSELFREMVRVYTRFGQQRDRDEERWIISLIEEARAEQRVKPMTMEEKLKESKRLSEYGAYKAQKSGMKARDINRIIHEQRKARAS